METKRRKRINYTAEQRREIRDLWKRGETAHDIGQAFDRFHTSAYGILQATGGIRPPERTRSRLALTLNEREEISRGLVSGHSIRAIARALGRATAKRWWAL